MAVGGVAFVAVAIADPDDEIVVGWAEPDDTTVEGIWSSWCVELVPRSANVSGIIDSVGGCDEVGSFIVELVMGEGEEAFFREDLIPRVTFVVGLPDRVVEKANEDGLSRRSGKLQE